MCIVSCSLVFQMEKRLCKFRTCPCECAMCVYERTNLKTTNNKNIGNPYKLFLRTAIRVRHEWAANKQQPASNWAPKLLFDECFFHTTRRNRQNFNACNDNDNSSSRMIERHIPVLSSDGERRTNNQFLSKLIVHCSFVLLSFALIPCVSQPLEY